MRLWDYTADEILDLSDNAIGMLVLEAFGPTGWNVHNFFTESQRQSVWGRPGVPERIADGWAWLEAQGLIGAHPTQNSASARRVTRAGSEALSTGLEQIKAGQRLNVDLHPQLAWTVRSQYLMGQYELAAFAALREVEVRVRALGGFSDEHIGVRLMAAAFKPESGPLADSATEAGEQEATMALFRGAIGTFKNPHHIVR